MGAQFANNFLIYKKEGSVPWKRWSKPENEEALIEIIRPYIFDCDLDLDVKINNLVKNVFLSDDEVKNYNRYKREFLENT